ncbi:hypothetical protein GGD83_001819 [Rhodoblastus sphagnicola]|uniref:hypothetical protein n=1 Tax=Rhodoblastus sphagnicola TaxID=333368 RepID=UPI0016195189|nr:hypothetical protein [Rhodoblastus sphagnicola]MBB4198026.1 hypothetical protein [Rhodoblastus sphagnicola]
MIVSLIAAFVLLLALMLGWIEVQRMARHVAAQHPEAGPLRLVGGGCGGQGHGSEAPAPAVSPKRPVAAKPEGCEACTNTACKPGSAAAPESCPPLSH